MSRSIAVKALRLAKGVALLGGFAVGLALILGVATVALAAAPGDPLKLGRTNTIDNALTKLVGSRADGPMLTVDNDSSAAAARALDLKVEAGNAPMEVNADAGKATGLNADKLDGKSKDGLGVNGQQLVFTESDETASESGKGATAVCPEGKVIVGTGYNISGGFTSGFPERQTDVVVTTVAPTDDSVLVEAFEESATSADWSVTARALCATQGTPPDPPIGG